MKKTVSCGNANEIIPDLIELGVDVLDPIQISAVNMDLKYLKKQYGKDISFHGDMDVQGMSIDKNNISYSPEFSYYYNSN